MINKVILLGNVGADPEVRTLESGVKVARLRMATTERLYNRQTQEAKEHTEWHTIVLWRNMADTVDRFVKKGSRLYIEGRLRSNSWTDDAGNKRVSIEILADDIKLLDRRGEGSGASATASSGTVTSQPASQAPSANYSAGSSASYSQSAPQSAPAVSAPADDVDDLPF